ncbi:MAG: hypothetical protein AAGA93_28310, partial [Actinomycetota bacterium]
MGRGQSLIVWAIAEGRACAASVDADLMGETLLPSPVKPTDRPLSETADDLRQGVERAVRPVDPEFRRGRNSQRVNPVA